MDDKGVNTRNLLLQTAEKLFTERGYDAVSTRDLADTAGVNLGAIQYHFGSKAQLFLETIHRLMDENAIQCRSLHKPVQCETRQEAIQELSRFITQFLDHLLNPTGPQACRMMFREIFTETTTDNELIDALVTSVVEKYIRPTTQLLHSIVMVLAPDKSLHQQTLITHSIIGQCSFYVTHRPFLERIWGENLSSAKLFTQILEHILNFTLRALDIEPNESSTLLETKDQQHAESERK
jgi:TetR/AcrR family transcriptional regulator, regulator of cefoperazone and chloramphenicol sensitivity